MKIFSNDAYLSSAVKDYNVKMAVTHPQHILAQDGTYMGQVGDLLKNAAAENTVNRGSAFDTAMLQALDKVSGAQLRASTMAQQAIIDPGSVDAHDVTIAQAEARMSLELTRNVLNRLVQGWRDLINIR